MGRGFPTLTETHRLINRTLNTTGSGQTKVNLLPVLKYVPCQVLTAGPGMDRTQEGCP